VIQVNILEAGTNRPLRIAEVDAGELPSLERDFIADIFDSRLTGMIVRTAFSASTMARVVERLESGAYDHHARASKFWQGRIFGPGLQTTTPDLREYFDEARRFRSDCAALFEGGPDFQTRIEELLAHSRAGRPVSFPRGPREEAYAVATIRGLVSGGEMQVHCDIVQFEWPAIRHLASQFDETSLLSYFVMLATPERGGELHIHALRYDDEAGKLFARKALSEEEALREIAPYDEVVLRLTPGDLLVFNAGHHFHHVDCISGSRTRWTQGGFLCRSRDGASVFCWD
jgi:hypothetical protein